MAKDDIFRQCELRRGDERITAWIPVLRAELGAAVHVLSDEPGPADAPFTIVSISTVEMSGEALRAKKSKRAATIFGDRIKPKWKR